MKRPIEPYKIYLPKKESFMRNKVVKTINDNYLSLTKDELDKIDFDSVYIQSSAYNNDAELAVEFYKKATFDEKAYNKAMSDYDKKMVKYNKDYKKYQSALAEYNKISEAKARKFRREQYEKLKQEFESVVDTKDNG